jgi:hypothetical protein
MIYPSAKDRYIPARRICGTKLRPTIADGKSYC